ncbi:hypothetical protein [Delftia tsuruhatensis]|uniref:hypothetical protein n=1 Tax=Delftia tsuruhatensis TaxID=180282 RepID=UPI003A87DA21
MSQTEEAEGVVYRHLEDSVERMIQAQPQALAPDLGQKVEILHDGVRRLIFVNGHPIGQVLKLETPRGIGQLAGVVDLSFVAAEIVERRVSRDEFNALKSEGVAKS